MNRVVLYYYLKPENYKPLQTNNNLNKTLTMIMLSKVYLDQQINATNLIIDNLKNIFILSLNC